MPTHRLGPSRAFSALRRILVLAAVGCTAATRQTPGGTGERADPYGGPPPGASAVRFAPGALPEGKAFSAAFTPDGRTVFFTLRDRTTGVIALMVARYDGERWGTPEAAPVARGWAGMDPFVTRDGARIYFSWAKPRPGMRADTAADYDTWVAERGGDGDWGEPRHVGDAPHSRESDMYPALTRDGTLYFDSMRPGLPARRNLWRARLASGGYTAAEPLPAAINDSAAGASNPYVDPDERYLIFSSGRAGGLGRADLWVAYRRADGSWGEPRNLGPRVNTADVEFCPTVSPDGRWLLFSRIRYEGERQVGDDVFIVGIDALPPA